MFNVSVEGFHTNLTEGVSNFNIRYPILTLFPPCLKLHFAFINQNSRLKKMVDALIMCLLLEVLLIYVFAPRKFLLFMYYILRSSSSLQVSGDSYLSLAPEKSRN